MPFGCNYKTFKMIKKMSSTAEFDIKCTRCPRISGNLEKIRENYPHYYARPVPPFGDASPSVFIVGLGPGMHGANATGRPFTGDYAGILLYKMLYEFGFSNKPESNNINDNLTLNKCRITNAVKCLPPENKPLTLEIINCNSYLREELKSMPSKLVILALGKIAHDAIIRAMGLKQKDFKFSHNALHKLSKNKFLLDSYHCSRYNTQTKRLTERMFREVFITASNVIYE